MTTAAVVGLIVATVAWFVARPVLAGAPSRPSPSPSARRRPALVGVLVLAAVCAVALTARAVDRRPAGTAASAGGTAASAPRNTPAPASPTQPPASAAPVADPPTQEQLEAVATAVARVRAKPRSVPAHLDLARAYASAQQAQLSTVEYLAVTRLDRANPEANSRVGECGSQQFPRCAGCVPTAKVYP